CLLISGSRPAVWRAAFSSPTLPAMVPAMGRRYPTAGLVTWYLEPSWRLLAEAFRQGTSIISLVITTPTSPARLHQRVRLSSLRIFLQKRNWMPWEQCSSRIARLPRYPGLTRLVQMLGTGARLE